jgi:hypothetical protein
MTARAAAGPAVTGRPGGLRMVVTGRTGLRGGLRMVVTGRTGLRGGLRMVVTGRTGPPGGATNPAAATGLTGQVGQLVLAPGPTVHEPAPEPASLVAIRGPATAYGTSAPAPVPSA